MGDQSPTKKRIIIRSSPRLEQIHNILRSVKLEQQKKSIDEVNPKVKTPPKSSSDNLGTCLMANDDQTYTFAGSQVDPSCAVHLYFSFWLIALIAYSVETKSR